MKNLFFLLNALLMLFILSCSEDNTDNSFQEDKIPVSSEFNKAFPEGFQVNSVDKTINTEVKSTAATQTSIAVPHFYQETNYWCGPASAQMVNYYFNMPVSQQTIANFCGSDPSYGTYVYQLVNWLNSSPMTGNAVLPSWWKWEYYALGEYSDFKSKLEWSIGSYSAPQIWLVATYPSSTYHLPGWTYNTGHFVTANGYNFGSSETVVYDDPWYGAGGGPDISVAAYTMYVCIQSQANYIIY
jgi:hypothetical protein